jgi:hypothetical protein
MLIRMWLVVRGLVIAGSIATACWVIFDRMVRYLPDPDALSDTELLTAIILALAAFLPMLVILGVERFYPPARPLEMQNLAAGRSLGRCLAALPVGRTVQVRRSGAANGDDGWELYRPELEEPAVVLCEFRKLKSGERMLARYYAKPSGRTLRSPTATPLTVLLTPTQTDDLQSAWEGADSTDIDEARTLGMTTDVIVAIARGQASESEIRRAERLQLHYLDASRVRHLIRDIKASLPQSASR